MSKNITIVQHYTEDIEECFAYVRYNNALYAHAHGYNYVAVKVKKSDEYDTTWSKVFILDKYINIKDIDTTSWFHFLDADAIYINHSITLESIINDYNAPVIISENGPNGGELLNMGSILLQASPESRLMIEYAIDFFNNKEQYRKGIWHEQTAINSFYANHPKGREIIAAVPNHIINSSWRWNGDCSMFIYHCMSTSTHQLLSNLSRDDTLRCVVTALSGLRDR